jgi:hypothetical protein
MDHPRAVLDEVLAGGHDGVLPKLHPVRAWASLPGLDACTAEQVAKVLTGAASEALRKAAKSECRLDTFLIVCKSFLGRRLSATLPGTLCFSSGSRPRH